MVKKATELVSLDELGLSDRTLTHLKNTFDSVEAIVREGRIEAFEQETGIRPAEKSPKWRSELVSELRRAGFIRPAKDFDMSFRVATLYATLLEDWSSCFTTDIYQLSNEQYEEFQSLSAERLDRLKAALRGRLTEREYIAIYYRYGLEGDDAPRTFGYIAEHFGMSVPCVRQVELKALRRLKHPSTRLPAIFEAPKSMEEAAENLQAELDELYESSAFRRAYEINDELERMQKVPLRYTCKCLKAGAMDYADIGELKLNCRVYNSLMRAGIHTVADIINLPHERWAAVRHLGQKALAEVIEKMHEYGYEEFEI